MKIFEQLHNQMYIQFGLFERRFKKRLEDEFVASGETEVGHGYWGRAKKLEGKTMLDIYVMKAKEKLRLR